MKMWVGIMEIGEKEAEEGKRTTKTAETGMNEGNTSMGEEEEEEEDTGSKEGVI